MFFNNLGKMLVEGNHLLEKLLFEKIAAERLKRVAIGLQTAGIRISAEKRIYFINLFTAFGSPNVGVVSERVRR